MQVRLHYIIGVAMAAAALLLLSCGCEGLYPDDGRPVIALRPLAAAPTKAAVDGTELPVGRTLMVSSYYNAQRGAAGVYFTGREFSYDGSAWSCSADPAYWPFSGTLDFLAVSADGVGTLPTWGENPADSIAVLVVGQGAAQCDILWGSLRGARHSGGETLLPLRHACALVTFTAQATVAYDAPANAGVTIEGIRILGTSSAARLDIFAEARPDGGHCEWSGMSGIDSFSLLNAATGTAALSYAVPAVPMDMSLAGNHMGIGGVGILVFEQPAGDVEVTYTIHGGKDGNGNPVNVTMKAVLPGAGLWEEGMKYVYALSFSAGEIAMSASAVNWN